MEATVAASGFWRGALDVTTKDLRVEFRSREIVLTMAFFAAMIVVLFSFAFLGQGAAGRNVAAAEMAPGFLWVAMLFSGTLGLGRAFDRERDGDTMRGLLLAPIPRAAIFLGKSVSVAVTILVVLALVVPLIWFFFDAPLAKAPIPFLLSSLLGTFGFAVVGSVFAAMLLRSKARDVLLPVVLYPILVPLFIAGIKSSQGILDDNLAQAWFWIRFLGAYDALFVVAALWTFESLVIE